MGRRKGDYTVGADLATSEEALDHVFRILGEPSPAPNGALYTYAHQMAGMPDLNAHILDKEPQDEFVRRKAKTGKKFPYTPGVGDCDSIAAMFLADMIAGSMEEDLKYGLAQFNLWYVSKTLGLPHKGPWDGYHAAPALLYKHNGEVLLRIRQPETKTFSGRWDAPELEVERWVNAAGVA